MTTYYPQRLHLHYSVLPVINFITGDYCENIHEDQLKTHRRHIEDSLTSISKDETFLQDFAKYLEEINIYIALFFEITQNAEGLVLHTSSSTQLRVTRCERAN